jgi:hypothetical protein
MLGVNTLPSLKNPAENATRAKAVNLAIQLFVPCQKMAAARLQ